jgi:Tfp pilus assembly protein PilO
MTWPLRVPAGARSGLPLVLAVTVFVVGSLTLVLPRMSRALAASGEAASLEGRKANMRRLLQRAEPIESGKVRAVAELPKLVSEEGGVPATIEALARLASSPGHPAQAHGLLIEAEQPRSAGIGGAATEAIPLDPRWAVFAGPLEYTPIKVTFEATYERLGLFLWRLRDLPTLVDVRSVDIERSLPLLKVKLTLFALHERGDARKEATTADSATGSREGSAAAQRAAMNAARILAPPAVDLENEPDWSHDPFWAGGESRRAAGQAAGGGPAPAAPDPVIMSILYAPDRRLAVIDRRTVRVGDSIAAGVIADIQPNAVVIRSPSGVLRRVEMTRTLTGARATAPGTSRSR